MGNCNCVSVKTNDGRASEVEKEAVREAKKTGIKTKQAPLSALVRMLTLINVGRMTYAGRHTYCCGVQWLYLCMVFPSADTP